MDSQKHADQLTQSLGLERPPVAVSFAPAPPPGISRIDSPALSSCAYWKLAQDGNTFYTEASDHYGCPIGAHTHGVELPAEKKPEMEAIVGMMLGLEYIREAEIPQIPTRTGTFGVAVYGPLGTTGDDPDVVLVRGTARQIMLLSEAANSAGAPAPAGLMGRPTCALLPVAIQSGQSAGSLACIGNRVYTSLDDNEFYFGIPGPALSAVADKLEAIVHANRELENFHRSRQRQPLT
jgi:uncharacterized protein (DUF169 family)